MLDEWQRRPILFLCKSSGRRRITESSPVSTFIPAKIVKRAAVARVRDNAAWKLSIYLQPPLRKVVNYIKNKG
jgi:hypothetical protein